MREGLVLDHDSHTYRFDGKIVPGVSEILTSLGLVDRSVFDDWSRDRGTAVHAAVQFHLEGDLDWSTVDPRLTGYVKAAIEFLKDAGIKPGPGTVVERPVYNALWRYAGTPDLDAVAFGMPAVIDLKTGGLGIVGLQTALYELSLRTVRPTDKLRRRIAVQLFQDGRYKKTDLGDGFDYGHAESAVSLFNRFILPRKIVAVKAVRPEIEVPQLAN